MIRFSRCIPRRPAASRPRRRRAEPAFTLIELMLVLTIIAVIMSMVLPKFNDDSKLRIMAAAAILRSDIEYAQVLTISNPEDPVLVRFKPGEKRYWLAKVSNDGTPIPRPGDGEPYLVKFGEGRASTSGTVDVNLHDIGGDKLKFNPQGGVLDPTKHPWIRLKQGKKWIKLHIANVTGTITEEHGVDP